METKDCKNLKVYHEKIIEAVPGSKTGEVQYTVRIYDKVDGFIEDHVGITSSKGVANGLADSWVEERMKEEYA